MCEQREAEIKYVMYGMGNLFEFLLIEAIAEIEKEREDKIAFELKQLNKENRNGN